MDYPESDEVLELAGTARDPKEGPEVMNQIVMVSLMTVTKRLVTKQNVDGV